MLRLRPLIQYSINGAEAEVPVERGEFHDLGSAIPKNFHFNQFQLSIRVLKGEEAPRGPRSTPYRNPALSSSGPVPGPRPHWNLLISAVPRLSCLSCSGGGVVTRSDLTQHPRLLVQEGEAEQKIEKEEVRASVWHLMSGPFRSGGRLLRQRRTKT